MKKFFYYIIALIVIYLYVYAPALQAIPIGLDKIIFAISAVFILSFKYLNGCVKKFKKEYLGLLLILICSISISSLHSVGLTGVLMYDIFTFLEVLAVPYAMHVFFSNKSVNLQYAILVDSVIASLITMVLLLNPSLADYVKSNILRIPEFLTTYFSYRGFGLSDGLLFGYPVVQGICAGIIFFSLSSGLNRIYSLTLIPILISVFVNARFGLVPFVIALFLFLVCSRLKKTINVAVLCFILLFIGESFLSDKAGTQISESLEWGMSTFSIIGDVLDGGKAENMDALTGSMVQFPHTIAEWLFGSGIYLFEGGKKGYNNSDIGYVLRLIYGGIIYCFLWLLLMFRMYKRLLPINKYMAYLLFGSLIFLNWKSDFFVLTPSSRFFFLLYALMILNPNYFQFRINK